MQNCLADNMYETDALVSQYCEFHYGDSYFGVENYPACCARLCCEIMAERKRGAALDLGCAVGRTSFELAREFSSVTGLDFSRRFIAVATRMAEEGKIAYEIPLEGELAAPVERRLAEFDLDAVRRRVKFYPGDALSLPQEFSGYDLIFAGNLIDRLKNPRVFLSAIHQRLVPGGLLVLTSPYTWLNEFTPRSEWLGGFSAGGRDFTTLEGLRTSLNPHFSILGKPRDIPFVIRETARKYQHSIAEMTVWERCR
ncbi:MAG: putative 4-mercaptohistidine N1-methyltransferase [Deltaproteobacteria bacterium]|nr:putative 4-mercaptohistidine N1-methyltransferase [Deltaproteobacteria bacterium]TLN03107.1 MAG: putative 4-mercaptohistidine N1-methyltransferase [bacterium]